MNRNRLIIVWGIALVLGIVIGLSASICLSLGWSPFLYRLHKEAGGIWKEAGIKMDYVEWKITHQEREKENKVKEILVVWRANFRNTSDKKKSISAYFELYDRDNFLIGWDKRESFLDYIEDEKSREKIRQSFLKLASEPKDMINLYRGGYVILSPKEEKIVDGKFWISKDRVVSVCKSELKLSAKEVNE